MRNSHKKGQTAAGLNLSTGKVADMKTEKVLEPARVSRQAIQSATDAAVMILRIDDVIASKGGGGPGPGGMPPGGPGGMEDYD